MARKLSVNAEYFVKRVETMLRKGGHDGLERLACRFLTGEDVKVAAFIWAKLTEEMGCQSGRAGRTYLQAKSAKRFCGLWLQRQKLNRFAIRQKRWA